MLIKCWLKDDGLVIPHQLDPYIDIGGLRGIGNERANHIPGKEPAFVMRSLVDQPGDFPPMHVGKFMPKPVPVLYIPIFH